MISIDFESRLLRPPSRIETAAVGRANLKKSGRLCALFVLIVLLAGCSRPRPTGIEFEKIDTSGDPEQHLVTSEEPIVMAAKDDSWSLTPKAKYRLSGAVVSTASYSDGWDSILSPVDLAVVWGKLADPQYGKHVSFSQSGRWYYYKTHSNSPMEMAYVATHSGNNHIIPGNRNLSMAVRSIGRNERIILEGFLVDVVGTYQGRAVIWKTSLSRADTGGGSCEIFYVTKVRIDAKVYE